MHFFEKFLRFGDCSFLFSFLTGACANIRNCIKICGGQAGNELILPFKKAKQKSYISKEFMILNN